MRDSRMNFSTDRRHGFVPGSPSLSSETYIRIMEGIGFLGVVLVAAITGGATLGVVYIILSRYFDAQRIEHEREWKEKKRKDYLPLQLQAYERLILFLERINPERLVFRVNKPGMSARLMQAEFMKIIREEFDHNLAQQLYVSPEAWEGVKFAKEESIRILAKAAERVHKDADSMAFSQAILEVLGELDKLPSDVAIRALKREFNAKLAS
jgi:hypothetical protein